MSRDAERLLAEVLKLPATERADLVRKAIASLDESTLSPDEIEAAWADEIARRIRSLEDGSSKALSRAEFDALVRQRRP